MTAMPPRDYNQESRDLEGRKYAYDFDYVHREYMVEALSPFFNGGAALELGCYKGEFTRLIAARFDDVTVVEAGSELIEEARAKVPATVAFIHSTFEAVTLDRRFDAIFLVHTLEHLDDAVAVLSRARGWLSEGGRLFVVVPNANAPSRQIAVHMGLISHNDAVTAGEYAHGHRRTYALDTLERDARAADLRVLHRGGVLFKPLANFQLDQALNAGIISREFIEGCYRLGMVYPDLCASVFVVCDRGGGP
jgi:2-polyprenyl-3-methyl-5-hydroxy-6-metoxy-1,4-benzoquinol methylase